MAMKLMMCSGGWNRCLIRRTSTFQSIRIFQKMARRLMVTWAPAATSSTRNGAVDIRIRAKIR